MRARLLILSVGFLACGGIANFDEDASGSPGDSDFPDGTGPAPGPSPDAPPDGDPPTPDPSACQNISGTWAGAWSTGQGAAGTWETQFVQEDDGELSGSSIINGTNCGADAEVSGYVKDCAIQFGVVAFGGCEIEFGGVVQDGEMDGTFTVASGPADSGSWSGTKLD